MKFKKILATMGAVLILAPAVITAGSIDDDTILSGITRDELIQKAGQVRQKLDALKWDLASTKDQTRDSENLTIRSNITTAEAIYNECLSLLEDVMNKISQNQLIGIDLMLTSITSKIIKARSLLDDARRLYSTIKITISLTAAGDRFNNLLKQAQDASGKSNSKIVNELIESALNEKDKAVYYLKLGKGILATEHFRIAENLLKKAIDLALKDISAQELISRGLERLQNLTQKAKAAAADNKTAAELLQQTDELKAQIRTALQENRYAIAIRLIQKTEELLLKAIELAGRDSESDSAADIIARYTSLLNTVTDMQNDVGDNQVAKLVRNARELADMGEQAAEAGKTDLSVDSYRKAVKLLLRAKELLENATGTSTADQAQRKLAALKNFLAKAAATIDASGNRAAANLLAKARGFYDRAAANLNAGKNRAALKQIQVARRVTIKALELAGKTDDRAGVSDRLNAEMEQVARLVKKAVRVAADNGTPQAIRLAARAEEILALARKADDAGNQPLSSEHLLTAARLAQRVLQRADTRAADAITEDRAAQLVKARALYRQLITKVRPMAGVSEQTASMVAEAERLMKSADALEKEENIDGALIMATSATNLLTKTQSLAQSTETAAVNHEALIEQIKSIIQKASQEVAAQKDENIKTLICLAAGYLARAREALRANHPIFADQQLAVARQMALKALQMAKAGNAGGNTDESRLNAELKKLDEKLNHAKSRLGR